MTVDEVKGKDLKASTELENLLLLTYHYLTFNGSSSCGTFPFYKAEENICCTGVIKEAKPLAVSFTEWLEQMSRVTKKYPNVELSPSTKK